MLPSSFAKGGQRQEMLNEGKQADGRRWGLSRRHCLFFLLVFAAVFFFYSANMRDMAPAWTPEWWTQNQASKWWPVASKGQRQTVASDNRTDSSAATAAPAPALATTALAALATAAPATTAALAAAATTDSTDNITASTYRPNTTTLCRTTNLVTLTPVPYKSPGPYLVEYPYEYHFIINEPQKCELEKPFVVLMVPVAPHNRAHRDVIRSTWGSEGLVQGTVVKLFFLLGLQPGDGALQLRDQLLQESKEHRDLIQSDFIDCYKNLTIKTMVMLEWLDSYCSTASYAMKIDSDMFLNVPKLVDMLLHTPRTNYMSGLVAGSGAVLRDKKSKWYVPEDLYPPAVYPNYALGLGYILSLDLTKKLIAASRHVIPLYIEDVFLGLCMQHLGIAPTNPPDWGLFHVFPVRYSRCTFSRLVATTTHPGADRVWMWKDFKRPGPYC